jgi:hypothetical protein
VYTPLEGGSCDRPANHQARWPPDECPTVTTQSRSRLKGTARSRSLPTPLAVSRNEIRFRTRLMCTIVHKYHKHPHTAIATTGTIFQVPYSHATLGEGTSELPQGLQSMLCAPTTMNQDHYTIAIAAILFKRRGRQEKIAELIIVVAVLNAMVASEKGKVPVRF